MSDNPAIPRFGTRIPNVIYHPRPGAYGIFIDDQQRLAALKVRDSYFLPGGGIDGVESPQEALIRETREECGWTMRIDETIGAAFEYVWAADEQKGYEIQGQFYRCTVIGQSCAPLESDHTLIWLPLSDAVKGLRRQSQVWAVEETLRIVAKREAGKS